MNKNLFRSTILAFVAGAGVIAASAAQAAVCERQIEADVVALDQVFFYNRLGAVNPAGMIYALRHDLVDENTGLSEAQGATFAAGRVTLRSDKRPRPIVLRMNVGDCLRINFENLLSVTRVNNDQPVTRTASVHVTGLQLVNSIADDGSNVGRNTSSLVAPGGRSTYTLYAEREGGFLMYSTAAQTGGEGDGGSLSAGLFGTVNVEPRGAEWYRSQVTNADLQLATIGTSPTGHPIIDFDRVYPAGHPREGLPVFNMLQNGKIIHSDLDAVITGPNRGHHLAGTYPPNPVLAPNALIPQAPGLPLRPREEPFREFTVVFHDEVTVTQAFPQAFESPSLLNTLAGVRDKFAINYGTGGVGAEIIANRLGAGPMAGCNECKYEEFFLSSWAVGDPAMVVDLPATTALLLGQKATVAKYPDDPSNVNHSYLGDHVKIRNVHAGPKEHHIFHLHAHQWLLTPDSDKSNYQDSQALGPGSAYTYEIAFNGSGNRNQTAGDAIFHCHFYPHFAQGMWALWRNHDVFEAGTVLDANGRPVAGARALPDGEIATGTPIPAVVPIPSNAMAPMPGAVRIANGQVVIDDPLKNPGFPFFIPGRAGHRPPHPPLDTVDDGGLPRHVVTGGTTTFPRINRLDFSKTNTTLEAVLLPEVGTDIEQVAMAFHAQRLHDTSLPDGSSGKFITNGLPPKPGAPYADPCVDDYGASHGPNRTYKSAHIQIDATFNKAGWHFPQMRIHSLWGDVAAYQAGTKAPEPMFIRANTYDCITLHHTNLMPDYYEQDDYQVRTPTDITGQHIHLVKFDVTSSDGAANGFNYEDGSFAPGEVIERIAAINSVGGLVDPSGGPPVQLIAKPHPFFGTMGAQTTVQRWYADPVMDANGKDRTLTSVFTHDHFGPSTHQQAGLYAGLLIEPEGSTWRDPETGTIFGSRFDGGPTSWRADIIAPDTNETHREFVLAYGDRAPAYEKGGGVDAQGHPVSDPAKVINPPNLEGLSSPLFVRRAARCLDGGFAPCPEAVSKAGAGTFIVNYRNEPLALRVMKPANPANPRCTLNASGTTSDCTQAVGEAGDLAFAYRSDVTRAIPALNSQPVTYPPLTGGVQPGDPYTPLLRSYLGDKVEVHLLVGAHEEGHIASIHGLKWPREGGSPTSGWRNAQMTGISEHFELLARILPFPDTLGPFNDHLWTGNASVDGSWNGIWGLLRAYNNPQAGLLPLPNNPVPPNGNFTSKITNPSAFSGACPVSAPLRSFTVFAVRANEVITGGRLIYNPRTGAFAARPGPLHDPTALLYVHEADLDATLVGSTWTYKLKPGVPVEPIVLRANAGDCIEVTVRNGLGPTLADLDGFSGLAMAVEGFNANQIRPSTSVGLHPQLVAFDVAKNNGINVGLNRIKTQTAAPNRTYRYRWYAGDLSLQPDGTLVGTPVEFGGVNLIPADPIKHTNKGLIGALVIEPQGATWVEDASSRLSATVTVPGGSSFREFTVLFQDDINLRSGANNGTAVCPVDGGPISPGCRSRRGNAALNYRAEPMWFRLGYDPGVNVGTLVTRNFTNALSNSVTAGNDPATPIFTARVGEDVRFRVLQPGGHTRNHVFQVHGHVWQSQPYVAGTVSSQTIGDNPLSQWVGVQEGHGPSNHFNVVLRNGAGGGFQVPGDYLIRNQESFPFDAGMWAILRVTP